LKSRMFRYRDSGKKANGVLDCTVAFPTNKNLNVPSAVEDIQSP